MPTVVVVLPSTTYRAADFVEAAQALDVDLIVASERPPPFDMGDRYLQIDCSDPHLAAKTILAVGDRMPIDGVVAADDAGVEVAALAGQALGVLSNPPQAAAATRDKAVQRALLRAAEVPQPGFRLLGPEDDPSSVAGTLGYPLVIKPIDRNASQGVIRVDSHDELGPSLLRLRDIVGDSATVLMEELMAGVEVAVEGLVSQGTFHALALFDKPGAARGPYFPETILVTPSLLPEEVQTECLRVTQGAIDAIGITHGPVHVELMVEGERARVIELAARSIGGLCSKSLNFGLMGTSLETLILRNAMGLDKPELRRELAASGVLMIPIPRPGILSEVRNQEEVRALPGITGIDITIRPGRRVSPPPEGDRYLGFVYARAQTPQEVESSLMAAKEILQVVVE